MRAILKRTDTKSHTHVPTAAKTREDSNGHRPSASLRFDPHDDDDDVDDDT